MEVGYTFFYVEANVVCLLFFLMLFFRGLQSIDRQEKQRIFDRVLFFHILYFLSDCIWALVLKEILPKNRFSASCVNLSNAIILSFLTYNWFLYVEVSQGAPFASQKKNRIWIQLPIYIMFSLILMLFLFLPHTMLDENLEGTFLYYNLFLIIPVIYISMSAIRSIARASLKKNYVYRKQYTACGIYPALVMAFGILQTIRLNAPLFCFGVTITLTYIYLISLDDQVSQDPLTKLNNRVQLKRYVTQEFNRPKEEKSSYYIVMMDLDRFKQINDRYGHVEGDKALQAAADALRAGCGGSLRPFIARYGGDEFILIVKSENEEDIQKLLADIRQSFKDSNEKMKKEYLLQPSIGYVKYDGDIADFEKAIEDADEALYREKAQHYQEMGLQPRER